MDFFELLEESIWISRLFYSVIAIVVAFVLYRLITGFIMRKISENKLFRDKKFNTYIRLFNSVTKYLFLITLLIVVLKINGVNITSILTGVGVLGVIFGFAVQDSLKDIVKGIDIIADSYYHVGDVIKFDGYTGVVISIGLKTTKIEDIYQKSVVTISNRNIEKVEVLSHLICIELPLPYELKLEEANTLLKDIVENIRKIDKVENAEYSGVNDFADSSIKYLIKLYCPPIDRLQTRRNALSCILKCLEAKDIHIPYNQLDIHQK